MERDFYELLGVTRSATEDEIKRAYRKLARQLHPDANSGDPESEARFKEVTLAYETLRDPERRRRYDMFGPEGQRAGAGTGDGFTSGFGDLFDAFFGGGQFRSAQTSPVRRGEDVEAILELSFEEAVFGSDHAVDFRGFVSCATCDASGAQPGTTPTKCAECGGLGQVHRVRQSFLGQMMTTLPCPRCHGAGELIEHPCPDCRGEGRRVESRSVTVEVPPGVDDGTTLRITGAGAPAMRGGVPGDLYVHLRVAAHTRFERSGTDLLTSEHISMAQAALGTEITVETLDGDETIAIPAGTQSGKVVRLRGRGAPHVRGRGRGDLHVRIFVDTPVGMSRQQEQLLRDFAAQRGEEIGSEEPGIISRFRSSFS